MKNLDGHESEAVVDATGSVRVSHLPYATGDRVRVLVLREATSGGVRRHTDEEVQRSRLIRRGLRGTVIRYDQPDEPVGVEDWDALDDRGDGQ